MDEEVEKPKDPFIGVFDIHFNIARRLPAMGVRIVHWKWGGNGELMYLIGDNGSIYNFHTINMMVRIGD